MGTQYTLVIYIDPSLTAPGNLANLAFARKVNGVANVIWQSKQSSTLIEINNFQWEQAYELGTTRNTSDGALISQAMQPVPIKAGEVCNWKGVDNPNVIPYPTAAPPGWKGDFGTIGLDSQYKVYLSSSTGGKAFAPIYADTHPIRGISNRAYTVENNFQVSWEQGNVPSGVITEVWSDPWSFPIAKGQTAAWISWGPKNAQDTGAEWFYYMEDPKKHNPLKSVAPPQPASTRSLSMTGATNSASSTVVNLSWEGYELLSSAGQRQYAEVVAAYLRSASHTGLEIDVLSVSEQVVAAVNLTINGDFYDLLEGSTRNEKTVTLIRGLMRCMDPRYTPTEQRFSSRHTHNSLRILSGPSEGVFSSTLDLFWPAVQKLGNLGLYATASLTYIKSLIGAATVPEPVVIEYGSLVSSPDGAFATTKINIRGINQIQVQGVLAQVTTLVQNEGQRKSAPSGPAPVNLTTPDPVRIQSTSSLKTFKNSSGGISQLQLPAPGRFMIENGHEEDAFGADFDDKAHTHRHGQTINRSNGVTVQAH